jgi:hypothetical protein
MVGFALRRVDEGGDPVDGAIEKCEPGVAVEPLVKRLPWEDGGCEKAFGCGVKTLAFEVPVPTAVRLSSSSSACSSVPVMRGSFPLESSSSFELLKILSLSLSLSSYSSWLLPAALADLWCRAPLEDAV